MKEDSSLLILPLLPLRDVVIFPHMAFPLYVGRKKSICAVEYAINQQQELFMVAQRRARIEDPQTNDIYEFGTYGKIIQYTQRNNKTLRLVVEGQKRAQIKRYLTNDDFLKVEVELLSEPEVHASESIALKKMILDIVHHYAQLSNRIDHNILTALNKFKKLSQLADALVVHIPLKYSEQQELLELICPQKRLERLYAFIQSEINILEVQKKIRTRVKKQMARTEKEYYLNEQIRAIQKELGERDEFKSEIESLKDQLKDKKFSPYVVEKINNEIKKLKMMAPMSAEATVIRHYMDWCLALPWGEYAVPQFDITEAEITLNQAHHGLKKIKERILEHLVVLHLVENMRGPILCLVGPPGVGKTSLVRSIAQAMKRPFVRQSLGGVHDEAEIRGHRRTYIGAMPGKIIQGIKKAKCSNPIFLLDEIDKISTDFRGDPASALLEVLDPEQNTAFNDHYLDMDYDLSRVIFICTANDTEHIPLALEDRLELIHIPGYTEQEKISIAQQHIIPRQIKDHGLTHIPIHFNRPALEYLIRGYTKEAGVRTLQREIASTLRKIAKNLLKQDKLNTEQHTPPVQVTPKRIRQLLGAQKYRSQEVLQHPQIGVVLGLAWTPHGGEILCIEATALPGEGKFELTGQLGHVMQESAKAALTYVRSQTFTYALPVDWHKKTDIHIHVPEGAIKKDGPSAGIAMAIAIISAIKHIPVDHHVAVTGEITTLGHVHMIGGLKEKILAAQRMQLTKVIFPQENQEELNEFATDIPKNLKMYPVSHLSEVLNLIFPELCPQNAQPSQVKLHTHQHVAESPRSQPSSYTHLDSPFRPHDA